MFNNENVFVIYSLFENAFKIKGTPEGNLRDSVKSRRLLGMASRPRRLSSPEPVSQCIDKENGSAIYGTLSEACSPQKVKQLHSFKYYFPYLLFPSIICIY